MKMKMKKNSRKSSGLSFSRMHSVYQTFNYDRLPWDRTRGEEEEQKSKKKRRRSDMIEKFRENTKQALTGSSR